jgi:cell division protease FtsH
MLIDHREHLEIIAKELLEKEILFQSDLERLIGKRPFAHQTTYEKFTNAKTPELKTAEPSTNGSVVEPKSEEPTKEATAEVAPDKA